MRDPTRDELLKVAQRVFGAEASDDTEEAIYWFAADWHDGQWSNLYSVLSMSEYKPGPTMDGPEPDSMSEMIYEEFKHEFTEGR